MKGKTLLTIIGIAVLVSTVAGLFLFNDGFLRQERATQEDYIHQAIIEKYPGLMIGGVPLIELKSVTEPEPGWYIANIGSIQETKKDVPVYVVLRGSDENVRVFLGPDIHFSEAEMLSLNMPDSVILELQK